MKTVKIYSTPTCHFCHLAKDYFDQNKVQYEEVNVAGSPEAVQEMFQVSGQMGVPVIKIGDEVIIGFDQPRLASLLGL